MRDTVTTNEFKLILLRHRRRHTTQTQTFNAHNCDGAPFNIAAHYLVISDILHWIVSIELCLFTNLRTHQIIRLDRGLYKTFS